MKKGKLNLVIYKNDLCLYLVHVVVLTSILLITYVVNVRSLRRIPNVLNDNNNSAKKLFWMLIAFGRYSALVSLPITLSLLLGLYIPPYRTAQGKSKVPRVDQSTICFRVVTRGTFPALVNRTVRYNLMLCQRMSPALGSFMFEIVTDNEIKDLPEVVRQVVVPLGYSTKRRTLFKARALHYALEDDWIFHLDEESVLTESLIGGIIAFINAQKVASCPKSFGQGAITYGRIEIINIFTTVAESFRVAADYGIFRFCLLLLQSPAFGFKGSFILAEYSAEKSLGFDYGPNGSLSEDIFFAINAKSKGYSFGWICGELNEKGTFSTADFLRQRKRWFSGIKNTVLCSTLPFLSRFSFLFAFVSTCTMPISLLANIICIVMRKRPVIIVLEALFAFLCAGVIGKLEQYGFLRSIDLSKLTWKRRFIAIALNFVGPIYLCVLESVSLIWSLVPTKNRPTTFYIVQKEIELNV
ncbi:hypothetical protein ACOME3_007609 [Neoechinorhynchus agilis]